MIEERRVTMPIIIEKIEKNSPAEKFGIKVGEMLVAIDGNVIRDVLDYRFYMTERKLVVRLLTDGQIREITVKKGEYEDLGLEFETYLMDKQQHCQNKCIFCFVDQLPKGLRESLYFKDDDSRMSFLTGSYVTLTNLKETDIDRIIKMRISPINISVHTTNPELRVQMLQNPKAGTSLLFMDKLAQAGVQMNTQLVICPGINDGAELQRSLDDLAEYYPAVQSIAVVPVGLTCHREGLYPLRPLTKQEAIDTISIVNAFGERMLEDIGTRMAYPADELFVIAEQDFPVAEYYDEFDQLEDGVGCSALLRAEFTEELEFVDGDEKTRKLSLACGLAAQPLLADLAQVLKSKFPNTELAVYGVENKLFGSTVNVSGLLCGNDLYNGLCGKDLGEKLLLPSVMLRHQTDCFLDDTTVPWLSEKLGVPVEVLEIDGEVLLAGCTY